MAATSAQTLASEGNCFLCYGSLSTVQMMRLALLARTLTSLDPDADVDPQSLVTYANCFGCSTDASMGDLMELALLDQIAVRSSAGVCSSQEGEGSPVGSATPDFIGQLYVSTAEDYWRSTGLTSADWTEIS